MTRKILSIMLVLALAVTSVFCLGTGPVPAAAAAEDPYKAVTLEGEVPTEKQNYLTDSQYKKLMGIDLNAKEVSAFDPNNTNNPLEGYQPTIMNELFLGYMNRGDNFDGEFAVMENVTKESEFDIDKMWNTNYGGVNTYYGQNQNGDVKTMAINTVALTPGNITDADAATREQILIENRLYKKADHSAHEDDTATMISTYTRSSDGSEWVRRQCKDLRLSNYDWGWDTMMAEQQSYTAMAVGDYDGDNYNEVAIYVPSSDSNEEMAYVDIYQPEKNGDGYDLKLEYYFHIHDMGSRFNVWDEKYHSYVHLNTTQIAGREDLVVSVTQPLWDENEFTENGALAVWSFQKGNKKLEFNDELAYDGYRFKMSSTTNADLDGDGTDELVVGGFKNTGYSSKKGGNISDTENLVNVLLYENDKYQLAWNQPQATGAVDLAHDRKMDAPAAMAAGKYRTGKISDTVFLEGTYLDFSMGSGDSVNEKIRNGRFLHDPSENIKGSYLNKATINIGASGSFVTENADLEQVVFSVIVDVGDYLADADIVWGHQGEAGKIATDTVEYNYIDYKYEDEGTILSMCPVNVDYDLAIMKYTGKSVGWSNPVVYGILMSMPYWQELDYGDKWDDRGSTSLGVSKTDEDSVTVTAGVDIDKALSLSGEATVMGSGMGIGVDFDFLSSYAYEKTDMESVSKSLTWSSGAGVDSVALLVMPIVSYKYDVIIPEHEATEEDKKNGKSGIVPAYKTNVICTSTYDPAYTDVPVETYNSVIRDFNAMAEAAGHSEDKLSLIDMDKIYKGAKVGNPSSYEADAKDINSVEGSDYLYAGEVYAQSDNDKGVETLEIETSKSTTESNGFSLGLKAGYMGEIIGGVDFMSVVSVTGRIGMGLSAQVGAGGAWATTKSTGVTYSGDFVNVPAYAAGYGYEYSAGLAKWNAYIEGLNETITFEDSTEAMKGATVVIGPTVSTDAMVPPAIPNDLHILGVTKNKAVLEWTNPDGDRAPDYYKVYYSKDDINYYPLDAKIDANKTRYVVRGLNEGSVYYFKIESYNADTSMRSIKSAPVMTMTKIGNEPIITKHPLDCYAKVGEQALFDIEAKANTDGNKLSYQWQQLAINDYGISWEDINVASDNSIGKDAEFNAAYASEDGVVRTQDIEELNGNIYRCVVAEHQADKLEYVETTSNSATLYVGEDNLPTETSLKISIGEDGDDEIIASNGDNVSVTGVFSNIDGAVIGNADVYFALMDKNQDGKCINFLSAKTDENGKATVTFENLQKGQYEITAIVMKKADKYRAAVSNSIQVTVNETYSIIYELNGGINHNLNPVNYSTGSKYILLRAASREGYEFTGWYLDSELKQKVDKRWLDISDMTGPITLYAGWELIPEDNPGNNEDGSNSGEEELNTDESSSNGNKEEMNADENSGSDNGRDESKNTEPDKVSGETSQTGDDFKLGLYGLLALAALAVAAIAFRRKTD